MKRLFGKTKKDVPNISDTIDQLKQKLDSTREEIRILNIKLQKFKGEIKNMKDGTPSKGLTKQRAWNVIQRRKMFEQKAIKLEQQSLQLEKLQEQMSDSQSAFKVISSHAPSMSCSHECKKQKMEIPNPNVEETEDQDQDDSCEQDDEKYANSSWKYESPNFDEAQLEAEMKAISDEIFRDDPSWNH